MISVENENKQSIRMSLGDGLIIFKIRIAAKISKKINKQTFVLSGHFNGLNLLNDRFF